MPRPLSYLEENGQIVGYVAEFREGQNLGDVIPGQRPVRKEAFSELEAAFREAITMGFYPQWEMYAEANIMVDPSGNLWLAETKKATTKTLLPDLDDREAFKEGIRRAIKGKSLREKRREIRRIIRDFVEKDIGTMLRDYSEEYAAK